MHESEKLRALKTKMVIKVACCIKSDSGKEGGKHRHE